MEPFSLEVTRPRMVLSKSGSTFIPAVCLDESILPPPERFGNLPQQRHSKSLEFLNVDLNLLKENQNGMSSFCDILYWHQTIFLSVRVALISDVRSSCCCLLEDDAKYILTLIWRSLKMKIFRESLWKNFFPSNFRFLNFLYKNFILGEPVYWIWALVEMFNWQKFCKYSFYFRRNSTGILLA